MKVIKYVGHRVWTAFNDVDSKTLQTVSAVIVSENSGSMAAEAKDFADFYNLSFYDQNDTVDYDSIQDMQNGTKVIYYDHNNHLIPLSLREICESWDNKIEYRAYWPARIPQLGMCRVLALNFERNQAVIANGAVQVLPKLDEIILMRYTGFKDKIGRKIFFNDFLYDNRLGQKFLMAGYLDVALINIPDWCETFNTKNLDKNLDNIEIIGNINENPELIKGISNWDVLINK